MFTGIVQGVGQIIDLKDETDFKSIGISLPEPLTQHLSIGFSVSINGCCLSVTRIDTTTIYFDIIHETLKRTNLKHLKVNQFVNVERSVRMNAEIGGHFLSGHIIDVGYIKAVESCENNCTMEIQLRNKSLMKYIFYKGYIGVDGISITIGKVYEDYFQVHLIPETMEKTNMNNRRVGDDVNIEVDSQTQVIVNTVERVLKENYGNVSCLCQCNLKEEENTTEDENGENE